MQAKSTKKMKNRAQNVPNIFSNASMLVYLGIAILATIVGLAIGFGFTNNRITQVGDNRIISIDGVSVPEYQIVAVDPQRVIIQTTPTGITIDTAFTTTCNTSLADTCIPTRVKTINGLLPDTNLNFVVDSVPGSNIIISPLLSGIDVATTQAVVFTTMAVTQTTILGQNTSCMKPLLPSCYDISGQGCTTPILATCLPQYATFDNLLVHNLTLFNATTLNIPIGNQTSLYVDQLFANDEYLNGTLTCVLGGSINNGCLNLGGYSCPSGMPLADSCIPASLPFYNLDVTNLLQINQLQCLGPPINGSCIDIDGETCFSPIGDSCVPTRVKTINGQLPNAMLDFALTGTSNQVNVANGAGSVTLSLPQNIDTSASPAFFSVELTNATISTSTRVFTIPDPGANANFVLNTAGPLTVTNSGTSSYVLTATGSSTASWQTTPVQTANTIFAGPTSGGSSAPTFRTQVLADLPHTTNGQLYVGSTGSSVVAATLTGTANQVNVANGAGSVTLSLPSAISTGSASFTAVTESNYAWHNKYRHSQLHSTVGLTNIHPSRCWRERKCGAGLGRSTYHNQQRH